MSNTVMEELTHEECVAQLAACPVGRIAVVVDGKPVVLPVNYRWIHGDTVPYVAVRTRPDNIIDRGGAYAAFEIDGVDTYRRAGWSVLVQGTLHHLGHATLVRDILDSHPWLETDRESWLLIAVSSISGRRLQSSDVEWAFHLRGYL
jgi:nitroimidazol reductase NimA-like FMN-containing flavoprotein (pyridoxamine 5'-phosphate oxidase superfamily)